MENYNMENQMQQMYQMAPMAPVQPKKSKLKWVLIIGIPTLVIAIVTTVILICVFNSSYDIDDYDKVAKACEEVFDIELEKKNATAEGLKQTASGINDNNIYKAVVWYEFDDEATANKELNKKVEVTSKLYPESEGGVIKQDDDMIVMEQRRSDNLRKSVYIKKDKYVMGIVLNGNQGEVEGLLEEFLDEID